MDGAPAGAEATRDKRRVPSTQVGLSRDRTRGDAAAIHPSRYRISPVGRSLPLSRKIPVHRCCVVRALARSSAS